ncbi:hypothetical protein Tco_0054323 [Tanacetum coccineum]
MYPNTEGLHKAMTGSKSSEGQLGAFMERCIHKDANQKFLKISTFCLVTSFLIMEYQTEWTVYALNDMYKNLESLRSDCESGIKGNQDNKRKDAWNSGTKDGSRTGKKEDSKALVTIDGEGVDWTNHSEEDEDYALMACNSSDSDTEVTSCSNKCKESYANLKKLALKYSVIFADTSQTYTPLLTLQPRILSAIAVTTGLKNGAEESL